ncbi:MAG: PaaI family thioesterase [Candidatus Eremiobacteraeota bacterium]|nr:PaaI family thioesterase [Candidatus Eremiobacteraeota bacterium]
MHLRFERTAEKSVRAEVELGAQFQGWKGIAHGGIAMALLDEAMAHAAAAAGHRGVTASMQLRFRKPVPLEDRIVVEGQVEWIRRNVLGLRARVRGRDGELLLEATGSFVSKGAINALRDRRST